MTFEAANFLDTSSQELTQHGAVVLHVTCDCSKHLQTPDYFCTVATDRVKNRLRNREAYQDFLKCLNLFATEIIARNELLNLVTDIIGRHADLMAGFTHFLNRCETMDSFDAELKAIAAHTKVSGLSEQACLTRATLLLRKHNYLHDDSTHDIACVFCCS